MISVHSYVTIMFRLIKFGLFVCNIGALAAIEGVCPPPPERAHALSKIELFSQAGFRVEDIGVHGKQVTVPSSAVSVEMHDNKLIINGKSTGVASLRIAPVRGMIADKDVRYKGAIEIRCSDGELRVTGEKKADKEGRLVAKTVLDKNGERSNLLSTYTVRVLLHQMDDLTPTESVLSAKDGLLLYSIVDGEKKLLLQSAVVSFKNSNNDLFIEGKKYEGDQLLIIPRKGYIEHAGRAYDGTFLVIKYNSKWLFVNALDLEQYLFSVLSTESWPGWPLEVNKAFAIMSRSYVMAMIERARLSKLPYHVKNTNAHQTYKGVHTNAVLQVAVDQTKGMFLAYENKPILAMYDCCCGGVVPAKIDDFDFLKAPYLARKYPCLYCSNCSLYEWQAQYTSQQLSASLSALHKSFGKIKQVKVTKRDNAGLVLQVRIRGTKSSFFSTGKKLYSLLKEVKSYSFSISKQSEHFVLKGRGYGHHLGVCQWGAREMVRRGKGYKDILMFYYPGTTFMRLK